MSVENNHPLVSVICICHNHEPYVAEAIRSVHDQTYDNVELIIVDDASEDESRSVIETVAAENKLPAHLIFNPSNLGHCKSFNNAFEKTRGAYVIDLAADDVLLADRIKEGVDAFRSRGSRYGVHYSNAELIDTSGQRLKIHNSRDFLKDKAPLEGELFQQLLSTYFICPPTMMYRSAVIEELGGYDEDLYYEDFDFWLRSSKNWQYCFTDKILVKKRELSTSKSAKQYRPGSMMISSTFKVCEKAFDMCDNKDDFRALKKRIIYEMKMALSAMNFNIAFNYLKLLKRTENQISSLKVQTE